MTSNNEIRKHILDLLREGASSVEVNYTAENAQWELTPRWDTPSEDSGELTRAYLVKTKKSGMKPEDLYVVEVDMRDTNFNWSYAYWDKEVFASLEDAEESMNERLRIFLEQWAETFSPFWKIGPSGTHYPPPKWWSDYGYDAIEHYHAGYHAGYYWKPISAGHRRIATNKG